MTVTVTINNNLSNVVDVFSGIVKNDTRLTSTLWELIDSLTMPLNGVLASEDAEKAVDSLRKSITGYNKDSPGIEKQINRALDRLFTQLSPGALDQVCKDISESASLYPDGDKEKIAEIYLAHKWLIPLKLMESVNFVKG